jgi:Na+:H+ antiporter, NhaA family
MPVGKFKRYLLAPVYLFTKQVKTVGGLLLLVTIISLFLANSNWGEQYIHLLHLEFLHTPRLPHSLSHWINDGLMAIFFFMVGMEIKREMLDGELSTIKKATLPVVAAIGGMVVPATLFLLINRGTPFQPGWGIPMATDIAFALGIASFLGSRIPLSLKVFLTALAIIDDLGAILVIALFYGASLNLYYLLATLVVSVLLFMISRRTGKVRLIQLVLGLILWFCVYNSGIHATVAGVIFAFSIPGNYLIKLEHKLHFPVNFIILPIFALANTAIHIPGEFSGLLSSTLSWGVFIGLFVGKPLGITLSSYYVVKRGYAELPARTSWNQMLGIGMLAGIGFTMSIFITMLAFPDNDTQDISKIAVLISSLLSMIFGYFWLKYCKISELPGN